jgi:23S rRNA pseudouridine1911/1915/1917 synthase
MPHQIAKVTGERLDAWLARMQSGHSRARWQTLIKEGRVTVNGNTAKPNHKLSAADRIHWDFPAPIDVELQAEKIPLHILYEDHHIIVIDKSAGLVVHPAAGNESGTLVNALLHHCTDLTGIGGEKRPGIVHRLDKETSGVIVIAKTEAAMNDLTQQFKDRVVEKEYEAIVRGIPIPSHGTIRTTIGRHPIRRKKMAVNVRNGRRAISHYKVTGAFKDAAHMRIKIETGRTHQIRVHMAYLHHPIIGDRVYGRTFRIKAPRQMLHASHLSIAHPDTGERLTFKAPLPDDMQEILDRLQSEMD